MKAYTAQSQSAMQKSRLAVLVTLSATLASLWSYQAQAGINADPADTARSIINGVLDTVAIDSKTSESCAGIPKDGSSCKMAITPVLDATALKYITRPSSSVRVQIPGQPGNLINEGYGSFGDGGK